MDREKFNALMRGYWESQILFTALSLRLFDFLNRNDQDIENISRSLRLDIRGAQILLSSLTSLGFVNKRGDQYRNSTFTKKHLLSESPEPLTGFVLHNMDMWEAWGDLPYVVKRGKPRIGFGTLNYKTNKKSLYHFALAMHQGGAMAAKDLSRLFDLSAVHSILDVGGCTGRYALSIMEKTAAKAVHVLDLPEMVREAKKIIRSENKNELRKIRFIQGSFFDVDPGLQFDLVIISNIIHSLSEEDTVRLLGRCKTWIAKKGKLLVHDFTVDKSRTKPDHAALFAVNMLVNTERGTVYTEKETLSLLRTSGFTSIKKKKTKGGSLALLCS